jgi:hypothetical protein
MNPRIRLLTAVLLMTFWMMANLFFYRLTIMPGFGWRYFVFPPLVLLLTILLGVFFIRSAYGLASASQGIKYFLACMFGSYYPFLVISDGRASVKEDEENILLRIGGPGFLIVLPGNVAVIENYYGKVRVLGPGRHFISRNETIKDYTHLEERYQPIKKLSARSKDGIEVIVKDIRYRYRIANRDSVDQPAEYGPESLFRYSDNAVKKMVYSRAQTAAGISAWEDDVRKIVESIILDAIRQHQVDYLIAPKTRGSDPRAEIYRQFHSPAGQQQFLDKGSELVWIDIGHFETPEENVAEQRVTTWRAKWLGSENVMRDSAEAQEVGKAEAQADILINIVETLASIGAPSDSHQNLRPLYLARIAQLLDAMREQ